MGLLFLLIASQFDVIIGLIIGPMEDKSISEGFIGFNGLWIFNPFVCL